ncbi:PREDICTED: uncharacterized protein LOC108565748 [Nicrophorus vespilloides]|uniref:Uncharacterized protein LOC108565748 n=1 Tax=Nicrophorus vespilloides TaxID=110193 RepID=A0ABM1N1Y1_NICVS|nr:PREDICTED: uncharacterized protein LOC108565748 [Nicrophorus vespilloides]
MQLDTTERRIMESRGSRHTLVIRKVHRSDFGNYTCVADNQLGKTRKSLQLTGKPNSAKFSSASRGKWRDSYNISWAVESASPIEEYKLLFRRLPENPNDDGHPQPLHHQSQRKFPGKDNKTHIAIGGGYTVFGRTFIDRRSDWRDVILPAMPNQKDQSAGIQSMSYIIRGLDPGQNYEAKVQARNRFGWSPISEPFSFQTTDNDMTYPERTQDPKHIYNENEIQDLGVRMFSSTSCARCDVLAWALIATIVMVLFA